VWVEFGTETTYVSSLGGEIRELPPACASWEKKSSGTFRPGLATAKESVLGSTDALRAVTGSSITTRR
jgi:hypothetical protein